MPRLVCIFLFCATLIPGAEAKSKTPAGSGDRDYVAALATANDFLHAWQTSDRPAAILLLSDSAKHHTSEDRLEGLLTPGVGTLQSYEITRGTRLKSGLYSFPVALFIIGTGRTAKPIRPHLSHIVVIRTGRDDWAVDKLP